MKIGRAWELRNHGGARPTWRVAPPVLVRGAGEPLARSLRIASNRQVKKQRLEFR